jgi:hypothetical protein
MWHDNLTKFHEDSCWRSSNLNLKGCNVGITDGRDL